ncbi:MAG: transposase [Bacteroidales bacterium]|nr:transposase [Bacteroidales bacterium]
MPFDPNIHHRRTIRLKEYDYSNNGLYYVTICTKDRECLFGEITDGKMNVNVYGEILESVWNGLPSHYPNVVLHEHIVMPDHFHAIIQIDNERNVGAGFKPAPTDAGQPPRKHGLSEIVRALKTFSSRKINDLRQTQGTPVWQRNYYEHIIRDGDEYSQIANYIMENPLRCGENNVI